MGQRTTPSLEQYLKHQIRIKPEQRLPFFNRVDNLCELSGVPMRSDLRREVERMFGFDMIRVIEGFSDCDAPRLSDDVKKAIRLSLPQQLELEFIRLFGRQCCDAICLTVELVDDLPVEPDGCEFALVYLADETKFNTAIYQWDGEAWVIQVGASGTFEIGEIITVAYTTTGNYNVVLNGGDPLTGSGDYVFDPGVGTLDITFNNGDCQYVMEQIIAPEPVLLQLAITYDDPMFIPGSTDPETWYGLLFDGITFESISIDGAVVTFYGYTPGAFKLDAFIQQPNIVSIVDGGLVSTLSGNYAFTILNTCVFPILTSVPDNAFKDSTQLATFTADAVTTIGTRSFENIGAMAVSFPNCTTIGQYSFYNSDIVSASFPLVTEVSDFAFNYATSLETYSFPTATIIHEFAFNESGILTIDFPAAITIGVGAFANCYFAATLSLPVAETLADNAFSSCDALTTVTFPEVVAVGSLVISGCNLLTDASFPKLLNVLDVGDTDCFRGCPSLINFSAPLMVFVPSQSFEACPNLQTIDLTSCVNLGETVGDDSVFLDLAGLTVTLTVPVVLQTCNAGNPDGDISYFASVSTVNVIYV